ncbi:unnamed protein product, partial [Brassica oleracea]
LCANPNPWCDEHICVLRFSSNGPMMNLRWSFDVLFGLFIVVSGDDMIQKAKRGMEAKQPNYGICKCTRVQLVKNGKKVAAFVPNDFCQRLNSCFVLCCLQDEVLISGFGRKGHAVGDIPGLRYKVVKVSGVLPSALYKDKKEKPRS